MFFGKNIKKIRLIKKLSQAAFAELFGLKRSSIGAYEEGRAEPKLEMIIRIAKYFGVSVDSLVNSELTVNELYGLDVLDSYLESGFSSTAGLMNELEINSAPLISSFDLLKNSAELASKNSDKQIVLPGLESGKLAVLIDEKSFKHTIKPIEHKDLVVIDLINCAKVENADCGELCLVRWNNSMAIGEIKEVNKSEYLLFAQDNEPRIISGDELIFIYSIDMHIANKPKVIRI